jgi:hypothetical protein
MMPRFRLQEESVTNRSPNPTSDSAIISALNKLEFNNTLPLTIRYTNNTNVEMAAARTYDVQYILESENTNF